MPSGTDVSMPSSGSVNPVPNAQRCPSSVSAASRSYGMSSKSCSAVLMRKSSSHVGDVVGNLVERRVAVHLVAGRLKERVLLVRGRRGDVRSAHYPDADALV